MWPGAPFGMPVCCAAALAMDVQGRKFGDAPREREALKGVVRPLTDKPGVDMTKIPQGEWSAIAARYAKGESVSGIARTYGCTPPAIHYILKRRKQCAAQNAERTVNGKPDLAMSLPDKVRKPATLASPGTLDPRDDCGTRRPALSGIKPVVSQQIGSQPVREPVAPSAGQGSQPVLTQRTAGRASAFTAGLDTELHGRAEA